MIAHEPKGSVETEQGSELAGLIGARLAKILEHGSRLAEVRAERARRKFLGRAIGIALASVAGLVLATIALVGAWQLARGLSQGLGELTGSAWIGDLASGVLLLVLVTCAAAFAYARMGPSQGKERESLESSELQALNGLKDELTNLGEDLVQAGKLRERVREHPYASLGAGLAAGVAAAPFLEGLLKQLGPLLQLLGRGWVRRH